MNDIPSLMRSVVADFGPAVRRSAPYLIIAAVVTAVALVALALFFIIKKAIQFYEEKQVALRNEVKLEVTKDLQAQFDLEKAELQKQSDEALRQAQERSDKAADEAGEDGAVNLRTQLAKEKAEWKRQSEKDLKLVKLQAAKEIKAAKDSAYAEMCADNEYIAEHAKKIVDKNPITKSTASVEKLAKLIPGKNPLAVLGPLLNSPGAIDKIRTADKARTVWEDCFNEKSEAVITYLPQFLEGMNNRLLIGARDRLVELCKAKEPAEFVNFINSNHVPEEIYGYMQADEEKIMKALYSGDLAEVETNGLKCLETIFNALKDNKTQLQSQIPAMAAKLASEVAGETALYLDAFVKKVGIENLSQQLTDQPFLEQLDDVAASIANKTVDGALRLLTNAKNWTALVTLLIHVV